MSKLGMSIGAAVAAVFCSGAMATTTLDPLATFGTDGWLKAGDRTYLTTDHTQRGLAYNQENDHLYLISRAAGNPNTSVQVINGTTGADIKTLDMSGISGGTFPLNMIGVGADGAIYAANLTTNATNDPLKIYRWADENATPTLAYSGVPTGAAGLRFGDTLAVRGSGANTQIALGTNNGAANNSYSVLTTSDGLSFGGNLMSLSGPANGAFRLGLAFGPGDTVYGKQSGSLVNLEGTTFNLVTSTATRTANSPLTLTSTSEVPIGIDPIHLLLASADITAGQIRLYDLSGSQAVLLDTKETSPFNGNANGTGSLVFGNGRLYVVNTNNGIQAFSLVPEPASLSLLGLGALSLLSRRRR